MTWELDDDEGVSIPFLSIQPLVENAVQHGIREGKGSGTVTVTFRKDPSRAKALITVEDDGSGIGEADISNILNGESDSKSGVGLVNVEKRLSQYYGNGLAIESRPNQGTIVSFEIDLV